jgi:hypothetical protein
MNFNDRAVKRNNLQFDADYLFMLQSFKNLVKCTVFTPAAHAGVYAVPVTKLCGKIFPFATHVQQYAVTHSAQEDCHNGHCLSGEENCLLFFRIAHVLFP